MLSMSREDKDIIRGRTVLYTITE